MCIVAVIDIVNVVVVPLALFYYMVPARTLLTPSHEPMRIKFISISQ